MKMNALEHLISVCRGYINGDYEIGIFQKKLEEIFLPDRWKKSLETEQHNAVNQLEEIQFCYLPEGQRKQAVLVAEKLICAVRNYLNTPEGKDPLCR